MTPEDLKTLKAKCESAVAEANARVTTKRFNIQLKQMELREKKLAIRERILDESIKNLESLPRLIPYYAWVQSIGRDLSWGHKYRKKGWIKTIRLGGNVFVTQEAIEEFQKTSEANKQ